MERRADPEAVAHFDEAGDVVVVRMRQHQKVDGTAEERPVRANATKGQVGIRSAVDQRGRATRSLDQDRVPLADVEDGDVEHPV